MKILLVSADKTLQTQLRRELSRQGLIVDAATDGEDAWGLLRAFLYDVVLLEAMLPQVDGVSLCRRLRDVGNPVLILLIVEAGNAATCLQGLANGADACLAKPLQAPDLLIHLQALTRRGMRRANPKLSWGPLLLDPTACRVTCQGKEVKLNRKEYQVLELLLGHPRQMFPRSEIGDRLWTLDEEMPSDATIKSHIRSLRRKLEQAGGAEDLIQTHYGQGYCLNPAYAPDTKPPKGGPPLPEMMMDSITANLWQELMAANARLQQEIEQRKQIEAQLRRSEEMLRTAQQVAQIGSWEVDLQTRITYWTEELFLIHGLEPNRPAPNHEEVLTMIHPEDLQLHEDAIRVPAMRGEAFEANLRIVRASDGEVRYINARGGPLFDANGTMVKLTGTTFDVTRWIFNGDFHALSDVPSGQLRPGGDGGRSRLPDRSHA
ncbi:response regulator transcription factor [Leptolyngbya sp. KIOST-1]|uniref:response regulator transcription factor n=1 Tax=Leptolyngbya sp. KIOST-1 TaxID=1229172 RepID=UPI0009079388|nr:response regulator transcription factor [Leptolyngbya sp. KIOST-1]